MAKTKTDEEEVIEEEIKTEEEEKTQENNDNYFFIKKISHWTLFRSFAILFLIVAVLTAISMILMKYLNYYFNFGPMDQTAKDQYKNATWWQPFSKWSWALFPVFQNKIENVGSNTVVIVEGITWAGTTMAVTRQALIINNIANGGIYIALPALILITLTLTLLHFLWGRKKIIALMGSWTITSTEKAKEAKKEKAKAKKKKPAPKKK